MRSPIWTVTLLMLAALACDKQDDATLDAIEAHRAKQAAQLPATKAVPTTQDLLKGPKTTLRLGELPLTIDVPTGWSLKSSGEGAAIVIQLSGPASSGEVAIQIGSQLNSGDQPFTAQRIAGVLAEMQKEADKRPHPLNRVGLRDIGPAKVLEQRMISGDFIGGKLAPEVWGDTVNKNELTGETQTVHAILNPHLLKWNLTVFIPAGDGKYIARSLTFISLRVSEYEQDQAFLEQLVSSLKYDDLAIPGGV